MTGILLLLLFVSIVMLGTGWSVCNDRYKYARVEFQERIAKLEQSAEELRKAFKGEEDNYLRVLNFLKEQIENYLKKPSSPDAEGVCCNIKSKDLPKW